MCDEVCSCCEKDVCKCPNSTNKYKKIIKEFMANLSIIESAYKILSDARSKFYIIELNRDWYIDLKRLNEYFNENTTSLEIICNITGKMEIRINFV